ncbi:Dof-type domain-containing protein [Heracleum sosnowskyi]|uniref:Dof-type domain-containing protein n=1 Tax=Heracleum sosnowskyi TaxID=360622 RepID=A0AAD8MNU0_9APIA|nr:Dof-type domain-containing protein [Heracleum sosnowskyi]KAK1378724.1 Dof-type domain-containing protein [Heracleum sosnowskyi]
MEGENRYEQQQPQDSNSQGEGEIKPEPNQKCPRCNSLDTRFCYFNNKKTSQPRYICKDCKRFWTQGGHVRNILSNGEEGQMKDTRDSSSSTAVSPPAPPLNILTAGGCVRRVGSLNFTRPQPVSNQPQLKFVRVDINSINTAGASHYMDPGNANIFWTGQQQPNRSFPWPSF